MSTTGKVFVAVAAGSFIGALCALELGAALWWLGALIGGVCAYFFYELRTVLRAVPRAWEHARGFKLPKAPPEVRRYRRMVFVPEMLASVLVNMTVVLVVCSFLFFVNGITPSPGKLNSGEFVMFGRWMVIVAILCGVLWGWLETRGRRDVSDPEKDRQGAYRAALHGNPIAALFYLSCLLLFGVLWMTIEGLPAAARFLWVFGKKFFLLVHSEIRLLCFVDATIGASIGFLAGNAIAGALAGGVIGVINYEIVSKRILHLIPRT